LVSRLSPADRASETLARWLAQAQKAKKQVIFLEQFFDELGRKLPIGKQLQSRLTVQLSNKSKHCETGLPVNSRVVGNTEVDQKRGYGKKRPRFRMDCRPPSRPFPKIG
jgi:hypothetical protein